MNLVWDFLSFKKNAYLVGHEEVAYQRLTKFDLFPLPTYFDVRFFMVDLCTCFSLEYSRDLALILR